MAVTAGGEDGILPLASVKAALEPTCSETFVLDQECDSETCAAEHCIWVANSGKLSVLDSYLSYCNVSFVSFRMVRLP